MMLIFLRSKRSITLLLILLYIISLLTLKTYEWSFYICTLILWLYCVFIDIGIGKGICRSWKRSKMLISFRRMYI